jgi:branched-chain amino acid transport system permease protein
MMAYYFSQIIEGIASGSLYGLLGLAIVFIYRSNKVLNLAQGEMATLTAYVAYATIKAGHPLLALPLTLIFAFAMGLAWVCILNCLRKPEELSTVILTTGIFAVINSADTWFFGDDMYTFPSPFPDGGATVGGVFISYQNMGALSVTLAVSLALFLFFKYSLIGIALQAIAEDPVAAKLKGVRVWVLVPIAWGISTAIGGLAGALISHSIFLHPNTMAPVLNYALVGAVIGGLQSSFGALAGGILVGVIESLATMVPWIGSELKTVVVFIVLIFFLMFRPRGLFGRDEPRKV